MILSQRSSKAYNVPLRALWLQSKDVIDVRITAGGHPEGGQTRREQVILHLTPGSQRLLGLVLNDNKNMRLGRWLRQSWEEIDYDVQEPIPASTIVYDQAAQSAYISLWPNLGDPDEFFTLARRAEVSLDDEGELVRIRIPVQVRRRREDELSVAAGYLPTR